MHKPSSSPSAYQFGHTPNKTTSRVCVITSASGFRNIQPRTASGNASTGKNIGLKNIKPTHIFIRTNGKSDAAIEMDLNDPPSPDEVTMTLTAALPLAVRPDAQTAAIIGFGSGISTHALLASPQLKRVDTIEIEAAMVEGAQHFRPRNERAYTDPRSHIIIDDAKAFFARSSARYDIIVSAPPISLSPSPRRRWISSA